VRIGELFAGYGGLGMGVQAAIAGEVVWVSHVGRPVAGDGDPRADRLGEGGAHLVGCGVAVEGGHDGVGSHDLKHAQPAPQRNSRPETDQIVGAA
jgi:hypothetical protein